MAHQGIIPQPPSSIPNGQPLARVDTGASVDGFEPRMFPGVVSRRRTSAAAPGGLDGGIGQKEKERGIDGVDGDEDEEEESD